MALKSKIVGGLAWTGLALVLAVPSADILSSQLAAKPSPVMTSDTDQVETASIGDPVDAFVQKGKPLPSYISDAPTPAPKPTVKVLPPGGATPMPETVTTAPTTMPSQIEIAAVQPVVPVPYPANMRPPAPAMEDPIVTSSIGVESDVVILPPTATPQTAPPRATTPPVGRPKASIEPRYVTEDELGEWDSGSLADYLETRGLIADASQADDSSAELDEDGFFLDDGPNSNTLRSRSRRNDGFFFVPN